MEQNLQPEQKEREINLGLIFKMLLDKIKLLIIMLLVGVFVGCGFGILTTYDTHYYGTKLEYYVNPKRSSTSIDNQSQYGVYGAYGVNVMDNMVKLLQSESFAEKLLLDELGLPRKYLSQGEYDQIADVILAANKKVTQVDDLKKQLEELKPELEELKEKEEKEREKFTYAMETKNRAEDLLISLQNSGAGATYVEEQRVKLNKAEQEAEAANANYQVASEAYESAKEKEYDLDKAILTAEKDAMTQLTEADASVEQILVQWRKTREYRTQLTKVKGAVSYSYLKDSDVSSSGNSDFARSFFYVDILLLNDEEFANFLLTRIKEELPVYISSNMAVPTGYEGTNCLLTTRVEDVQDTNPGLMRNQAIKYGLLLGAIALVLTALIIIVVENSNRKLRDYDELTTMLNLPILGIIPALDLLELTNGMANKKVENAKEDKNNE